MSKLLIKSRLSLINENTFSSGIGGENVSQIMNPVPKMN